MNVGIIGTGSMGGMLARSLVRFGALRPEQLWAANRSPAKLEQLEIEVPGINPAPAAVVADRCQILFLCVKPLETATALTEMDPALTSGHLLVLLSNMLDIGEMEQRVPARVAKVIPSLIQHLGGGALLLMFGRRTTAADRETLHRLLGHLGRPLEVAEDQGRICSDLSSCGPAFIAYVLHQMARAAAELHPDLPLETAETLVRETALGTARLLLEGDMSFNQIIERISVPGGITAEGIKVLSERVPHTWREVFATTHTVEEVKKAKMRR